MSFKSYLSVLKNTDFTKLWVSQATSQLTNYILSFAILVRVFKLTNSSFAVSAVILAFGLATLFFGSIAGVYADRFDRRKLLTIINFLQAASIALYFLIGGGFWQLVIITFLYSAFNQFYIPAEAPSIPNLVPPNQLLVANSYFAFTGSGALILGFAAAGPMIMAFGEKAPFAVGTALLLIATLATYMLPPLPPAKKQTEHTAAKIWSEFKEGVAHLWDNDKLHFPLLSLVAVQIVNGMMITVAPAFMKYAIGINLDTGSLLVVAPLGLGILSGALLLGLEEKYISKTRLVQFGFLGMGLMITSLSFINFFVHKFAYYSIIAFVMGIFNSHIFAPSHSLLQTHALSNMRGRIYGTLYLLLQLAATMPSVIAGALADKLGLFWLLGVLGLFLIFLGRILIYLTTSDNRLR